METLDRIISDDLIYTHASGLRQSKFDVIGVLGSSEMKYESITPYDVRVRIYNGTAIVAGRATINIKAHGEKESFEICYLDVYVKQEGRWQMVAWQSSRVRLSFAKITVVYKSICPACGVLSADGTHGFTAGRGGTYRIRGPGMRGNASWRLNHESPKFLQGFCRNHWGHSGRALRLRDSSSYLRFEPRRTSSTESPSKSRGDH